MGSLLSPLFASTLFLGAALLFVVQPMVAKMVLPLLGGTPAVWNTCMVFFQGALLAGYAYAHAATAWLDVRRRAALHAFLLALPLASLPMIIPRGWTSPPTSGANPGLWLLGLLAVTVGPPFLVVASTAPLLQGWFSQAGHRASGDPYFLYAASNGGSMIALLGYPLAVEPNLHLTRQGELWAAGYGVLAVLVLLCAAATWRSPGAGRGATPAGDDAGPCSDHLRPGAWLGWVTLSFIPSSLMLGVTTYLTTDLAAIPLLWVIPLALYLLSFILVFARRPTVPHAWMVRALPMMVVLLTLIMGLKAVQPVFFLGHLLTFFVASMVCHGELVRRRPPTRHLTAFYLAMSLGGVLGGVFNALIAPVAFDWVAEYPLALVLACLALPSAGPSGRTAREWAWDLAIPLAIGLSIAGLLPRVLPEPGSPFIGTGPKVVFGLAALACYALKDRPIRFALAVGAVLLAGRFSDHAFGRVLHRERNFFGVLRVANEERGGFVRLIHGNTLHGQQSLDPLRRREPLTYYHRTGPIGQVLETFARGSAGADVAVVGLGAGSLACYAAPGQRWTFYEIDPAVARIARDPRYFTYLRDCRARACEVVLGDARLRLRDAPDRRYGVIALDAFSSDAIPTHLLTREALRLYRRKLADGGLIVFHISNRYIDLAPVLAALARDAGLIARTRYDLNLTPGHSAEGKFPSIWLVMAAREADLGALAADRRWVAPRDRPGETVWSDDFTDLVGHFVLTSSPAPPE